MIWRHMFLITDKRLLGIERGVARNGITILISMGIVLTLLQGWRRNVEANLFVTTLRDHFREKLDVCGHFPQEAGYSLQLDDWALEYIDIRYLQQLKEALDEDGSGYITISEVNRFANSQPQNLGWRYVVMFSE